MFLSDEVWERGGTSEACVTCHSIPAAVVRLGKIVLYWECLKPPSSRQKCLSEQQLTKYLLVVCRVPKSVRNF